MGVIPFYGAGDRRLFEIERAAMDRPGRVVTVLDEVLPRDGLVIDVGAGDGFTAERLRRGGRRVVALEPAEGMRRPERRLLWAGGEAEHLPFRTGSVDAAYSTWAYFFSREWDPTPGLRELDRVVHRGGVIAIVDNLGDDEFTALAPDPERLTAYPDFWKGQGFDCRPIDTVFQFESPADADQLLTLYFGPSPQHQARLTLTYRAGLFIRRGRGPSAGGTDGRETIAN